MFDFKALGAAKSIEPPSKLSDLFKQLDRKATHISLRPAQIAACNLLDEHIEQKDNVVKLSTGSGKTVVGLLYAERMRQKNKGEPVIYLCPTTQLVEQVVATGSNIGIKAISTDKTEIPYSAQSGESIFVCTYDKLFNAKNVFASRGINPSTIILDDCHAGLERVKGCYTLSLTGDSYTAALKILQPLCENTDSAAWRNVLRQEPGAHYEVPYWIWREHHKNIYSIFEEQKDESLKFCWDNVDRYFDLTRCCISSNAIEISLPTPPVEENSAYANARHRLFMSASVKDGSMLISSLDCDPTSFTRVIEPAEDEGAGERMILPISLIDNNIKKEEIAEFCADLCGKNKTNIVVLTSSESQAKFWINSGADFYVGKDVDKALETLKTSIGNYVVFAQRFDGVDLADDACRVLVVDGIPVGDKVCEQVDAYRQKDSPAYDVKTVNKFEQALGRSVRSSADYSAVLLVGSDVASFIGKRSVSEIFESRTKTQVDLGRDLAKQAHAQGRPSIEVIQELITALLSRDEGWKEAHRNRVREAPKIFREKNLTLLENVSASYRDAWLSSKARNFQDAVSKLRQAGDYKDLNKIQKAEILYSIASYLNEYEPAGATNIYKTVFSMNPSFPRPPIAADKKFEKIKQQASAFIEYFGEFDSSNAAIARLDEIASDLAYANKADTFERGLLKLGEALGATSLRPEKETNRGPDCLWIFDDFALCIEAKNEKTAPISKGDAGQLALSITWSTEYLENKSQVIPIFATNVNEADRPEDIAYSPKQFSEKSIFDIISNLKRMLVGMTFDGPLFSDAPSVTRHLSQFKLNGRQILEYLTPFGKS